jgi:hypothetical protein
MPRPLLPRLSSLIAGLRRWLNYRPERSYMRGRMPAEAHRQG